MSVNCFSFFVTWPPTGALPLEWDPTGGLLCPGPLGYTPNENWAPGQLPPLPPCKSTPVFNVCIAADFIMGVYLLLIGTSDAIYRNQYNRYALSWMDSWCCQSAGFLAVLSCEV